MGQLFKPLKMTCYCCVLNVHCCCYLTQGSVGITSTQGSAVTIPFDYTIVFTIFTIKVCNNFKDLYPSPNIVRVIKSRRMRWVGHVARLGEERGVYRVLVGKPEGRRPLGRPRRRWADNIRTGLQEVGCEYMDWIGLAQDRDRWRTLVSAVMNLRVP